MPVPCTARVRAVYGIAGTIHDLALFPQAAAAVVPGTAGGTPCVVNIKNYIPHRIHTYARERTVLIWLRSWEVCAQFRGRAGGGGSLTFIPLHCLPPPPETQN